MNRLVRIDANTGAVLSDEHFHARRNLGQIAELLVDEFRSLGAIAAASVEALAAIHGIGDGVAESVHGYFASDANAAMLDAMRDHGVRTEREGGTSTVGSSLAGATFVLTGELPTLTRAEAGERIKAAGGRVTGSVSGKTTYLVAGASAGSKLAKAEALEVPVLDEDELLELLSGD